MKSRSLIQRMTERMESVLESWGLASRASDERGTPGSRVSVLLRLPSEDAILVGVLTRDEEEDSYVFAYSREFVARADLPPIGEFPDKTREYRSRKLWPFFEARLPSTSRVDVRRVMEEKRIEDGDIFRRLGELSQRSVASPYELRFQAEAA